jgi:hypothetical protein
MSGQSQSSDAGSRERFRLQFQQSLREYLARNGSAAEGFGLIWEKTAELVALNELEQAQLYWELIQWARSYDLFTSVDQRPLSARQVESRAQDRF